ncbi:MAG: hypothetical protein KJ804_02385 [Proteobacteria bacterium]|nr:hypothetical protein [Pseudomonadota bacterium]MBU1057152.1 hypothetical protein [Pseudomonadota bacterium]
MEEELAGLAKEGKQLRGDVATARKDSALQLTQVTNYQARVDKITNQLKNLNEPTTSTISNFSAKRKEWQTKKDQISGYDPKEVLALAKEQQNLQKEYRLSRIDVQIWIFVGILDCDYKAVTYQNHPPLYQYRRLQ